MHNPAINPNISGGQADSMAASSAMIVSGLNKELKTDKANIVIKDPKVNLKQLEEYIKKLSPSSPIEQIKKHQERKKRKKQEQNHQHFKITPSPFVPAEPFEWSRKEQLTGNFLIDIFISFQQKVLQKVLNFALQPGLNDLIILARELKININGWNLEKFKLNPNGEIVLSSDLLEEERRYILLREEFKILEIGELLEDNWVHLLIIKLRKQHVLKTLYSLKIKKEEIEHIKTGAKQIAWLKLLTQLKAAHLKRVFCGSKKDFDCYSKVISYYTQKIRNIKINISEEGVNWIKARLHKLALETANYKLELLRSMQKLNHCKTRQKDIKWLERTVSHLQHS